jgi:hypothetical protein
MLDDNILIKGTPHDDAFVFLKVTIENEEEINSLRDDMIPVLNNILHMYARAQSILPQILIKFIIPFSCAQR